MGNLDLERGLGGVFEWWLWVNVVGRRLETSPVFCDLGKSAIIIFF